MRLIQIGIARLRAPIKDRLEEIKMATRGRVEPTASGHRSANFGHSTPWLLSSTIDLLALWPRGQRGIRNTRHLNSNETKIMGPLISVAWLQENLTRPDLIILEAGLPSAVSASAVPPPEDEGIPGSIYVDLNKYFADEDQVLPHMLATPNKFSGDARALGVNQDHTIVVFDKFGIYASPRLRLAFKAMGHDKVAVLNGGLPAWRASGPTSSPSKSGSRRPPGNFVANFRPKVFCDAESVREAMHSADHTIVDARSSGRFEGTAPEPRANCKPSSIFILWHRSDSFLAVAPE